MISGSLYDIIYSHRFTSSIYPIQVNLDVTDSMGPGKLVRHMQNLSYTYDEYLICIGLGPSISSVICKNLSYSGPSYPSSPVPHLICSRHLYNMYNTCVNSEQGLLYRSMRFVKIILSDLVQYFLVFFGFATVSI